MNVQWGENTLKKLLYLLFYIPIAIVLIVLSVANRQTVTLGLDPFNTEQPALSIDLPFFVFLFLALLLGMLIGSVVTWVRQGRNRRDLKQAREEASKLKQQREEESATGTPPAQEIAPGLPAVTHSRTAA